MRERRVERRRVGAETGACGVRQVGAASDCDRVREPKNCDLRQVNASTPDSSSPRLAKYFVVRRWASLSWLDFG